MPYRLRPSVHFGPTAEGVQFQAWNDAFVVRGPASLYPLCAHLIERLEHGATRDQLVAGLPSNLQSVALYMVDELVKRNAVLDTDRLSVADVGPDVRAEFADTIGYLESVSDDPYAAFSAFRRARVLAVGRGQSHYTLVRALMTMGLGSIQCTTCHDTLHAERLRTLLGERRTIDGCVRDGGAFEPAARGERWDLVVYMADAIDDAELLDIDSHLLSDATAVIAGCATSSRGIVGPLRTTRADAGLRDAIARAAARGADPVDGAPAPSPVLATVTGNIAAFESFKWLSVGGGETSQGRAAVVSGASLSCSFHPVDRLDAVARRVEESGPAATLSDFTRAVDEVPRAELLQRLTEVTDPIFGLIADPHPGGLPQTPLSLSATRLPGIAAAAVIGIGRDEAAARYDAIVGGLKAAMCHATPAGAVALAAPDGSTARELDRSSLEMAAGTSYAAWLSDGLQRRLAALMVEDAAPMRVTCSPMSFETCTDRSARGWWKSLALRFDRSVRVLHFCSAALPGLHVATVEDTDVLGIGCGATADAAVAVALQRAVARVQLTRAGEPIDGLCLVGVSEPAPEDMAAASRVEKWLSVLRDLGWWVGVHPCAMEPAIRRRGLLLGWVGIHAGR